MSASSSSTPYYGGLTQRSIQYLRENIKRFSSEQLYSSMSNLSPGQMRQMYSWVEQNAPDQVEKVRVMLGMRSQEFQDTVRYLYAIRRSKTLTLTDAQWAQRHTLPDPDGYNLTNLTNITNKLPDNVLKARCRSLDVEFLKVSHLENAKNHVVLKANFFDGYAYRGARIAMDVDFEDEGYEYFPHQQAGKLMVKPLLYNAPSTSSLRTFRVDVRQDVVFSDFIGSLLGVNLNRFDFTEINSDFKGCRDWISQALYILNLNGLISGHIAADVINTHWPLHQDYYSNTLNILILRFKSNDRQPGEPVRYPGEPVRCPIDKGEFTGYPRMELPAGSYSTHPVRPKTATPPATTEAQGRQR